MREKLGITENAHNDIIIDAGFEYLSHQPGYTMRGRKAWTRSSYFWSWWWRNWLAVDEALLKDPVARMAVEEYLRAHRQAHPSQMPRTFWRVLEVTHDKKNVERRKSRAR